MTTTTELTPLLKRLKLGAVLNTLPERVTRCLETCPCSVRSNCWRHVVVNVQRTPAGSFRKARQKLTMWPSVSQTISHRCGSEASRTSRLPARLGVDRHVAFSSRQTASAPRFAAVVWEWRAQFPIARA